MHNPMRFTYSIFAALLVALLPIAARAQGGDHQPSREQLQQLAASLKPQQGHVTLGGGLAQLSLPENLRYLSPQDTATVLSRIWGNPPQDTLGMIVPDGFNPLSSTAWAVEISYEEGGYVKDDDADKIDYSELLKQMQEGTREGNEERAKEGYAPIELIGWATPPRYDRDTHKLYWAKELKFGTDNDHTLNYSIRILGRQGVLVLNAIAGMDQLATIEKDTPQILSAVEFNQGHRYADFDSKTDRVATYGIAALVAGGVATKLGLFKTLWIGILAFKKFIVVGVIAAVAFVKRLLGKRS